MALAWFRALAGARADVYSAGSAPAAEVNPAAVAAMSEVGIDIARAVPRRWDDAMLAEADVVVTMGCGDTCPYVPGTRYEDWTVDDPAGQPVERVRAIRDDIRDRVRGLLDSLGIEAAETPQSRA
jgi:protein-tyrosine-phosphatase